MKFILEIELGNDAGATIQTVLDALERSRNTLEDGDQTLEIGDRDHLWELDSAVGKWEVTA